jgi:Zn-dependent alcohol dehydrogenase
LTDEKPLTKMEYGDNAKEAGKHCPSCAKNALTTPVNTETWLGEINFSNEKGEVCKIGVAETIPKVEAETPSAVTRFTTIAVNYVGKAS